MFEILGSRKIITAAMAAGLGSAGLAGCGGHKHPPSVEQQRFMTAEECEKNFWHDKNGQRQPLIHGRNFTFVKVDGRCNTPLDSPKVGIYETPHQKGKPSMVAMNGEKFILQCYTYGELIHDIRGQESVSDVWLRVGNPVIQFGFIPEVNVGYVDESKLKEC